MEDYYAVHEVSHDAGLQTVRKNYRRLAVTLHPDKNPNHSGATAAFQLLSNAYETIMDPEKRRKYDTIWPSIGQNRCEEQESRKREAEAAGEERKQAAEEAVRNRRQEKEIQDRLQHLFSLKFKVEGEILERDGFVKSLAADLKRLRDHDIQDLRRERKKNSWWTKITSSIYGEKEETEQQKQEREIGRLHRLASRRIKEQDLAGREPFLQHSRAVLADVNGRIAAMKREQTEASLQAARRQEQLRRDREARERAAEEQRRKRREEEQIKVRKEQAAAHAKAAREAQEARKAYERRVWEEAAEKSRLERERRVQEALQAEMAQKARKEQADRDFDELMEELEEQERVRRESAEKSRKASGRRRRTKGSSTAATATAAAAATGPGKTRQARAERGSESVCSHSKFWPKVEGRHRCGTCNKTQKLFAFRCPGCEMMACADCRGILRGEKRKEKDKDRKGNGNRDG